MVLHVGAGLGSLDHVSQTLSSGYIAFGLRLFGRQGD